MCLAVELAFLVQIPFLWPYSGVPALFAWAATIWIPLQAADLARAEDANTTSFVLKQQYPRRVLAPEDEELAALSFEAAGFQRGGREAFVLAKGAVLGGLGLNRYST